MNASSDRVNAWSEPLVIPTYAIGSPEKNPMFLERRVYQGSSGAVYPYPVIDRVLGDRVERTYTAVFLENRYLKVMVLPELGGRVQTALDKTNGYHFVYYNRVIKPALVGLCGPWISGGIEFNWPQHHRPSTFEPVEWTVEESADGSRTVWCAEIERMSRTRGRHGFRVYPDRAYLEVDVRLSNRTDRPQTFLWWANPAVHVHDDYQSVFPPDVHAVMDHGKRAVSDFPIATGTYYKVNYAPGTDISRYSTIPVPTSYMAYRSDYDFLGCYDHRARAGLLHVADHHVVPGKKQWTWGNGDFGRAWDRNLTDDDGPYIELMCGAYTDNQPDFSWLMPGEEKSFTQIFLPYKLIGPPKNASRDVALALEFEDNSARVGVYVTAPRVVRVSLITPGGSLFEREVALSPETALIESVPLPAGLERAALTVEVRDQGGSLLLAFTPPPGGRSPVPEPARAARPPGEIASNEELFLNGLHLEQYRHVTFAPEPYYEEALRRDPGDSRCHTALGRLLLERGKFAEAETHFRAALERLTLRNPNPYDGEPYYHLGRALKFLGRDAAAYDAFFKAFWNDAWKGAAAFELARLAAKRGEFPRALDHLDQALAKGAHTSQARHLRVALLRRLGRREEAVAEVVRQLERDPLDLGALNERRLLGISIKGEGRLRSDARNAIEIALDYAHAGLANEALDLLAGAPRTDPMVRYFAAWIAPDRAGQACADSEPNRFFPNQLECIPALQAAIERDPIDWVAPYGLGNFWYAHRRPDEAIACWERSLAINPTFPTVHRNLGLAYANKRRDWPRARAAYERAFLLDPTDARVFFELDQLRKRLNEPPAARLEQLELHADLVERRDDLTIERVTLLNLLGRHREALDILRSRTFHPWEGGEGKPTGQYVQALTGLARAALREGRPDVAIDALERARSYPDNLGEGKLHGAREDPIHYWLGVAHTARGDAASARAFWNLASQGTGQIAEALYYNDQPPEMLFYQGLALQELGRDLEARERFEALVGFGRQLAVEVPTVDYFAVSRPDFLVFEDDPVRRQQTLAQYLIALGLLGLGQKDEADATFARVLEGDADHAGAVLHRGFDARPGP